MESNVKKILLIVFIALAALLVPWWMFVVKPIWAGVNQNIDEANKRESIFTVLQRTAKIYLAKSDVQDPAPATLANTMLSNATDQAKKVQDAVNTTDADFESWFKTAEADGKPGKPADDDRAFTEIYQQTVPVENGLATLLKREGLYDVPAGPNAPIATSLVAKTGVMSDVQRKALQKQVWIYQRLIYSLLKNASDGTRLIVKVAPPEQRSGSRIAITIANCDDAAEKDKTDARKSAADPPYYGGTIKGIEVRLTVILDERHITEFLAELNTYNEKNLPVVAGAPNATPVPGLSTRGPDGSVIEAVKPITFIVKDMTVRRITRSEDPLAPPEPGKVVESPSLQNAQTEVNALHPWVKMDLTLTVPDFNPNSNLLKVAPR